MLIRSNVCVIMLLRNLFVFYQVIMFELIAVNVLQIRRDLKSEIHVQDVKFLNKNIES